MSMDLQVYVGPYLEAWNFPDQIIWDHDSVVSNGRGELSSDDEHKFLVPNVKLKGVDRQMTFDRHSEQPAISIPAISHEIYRFEEVAKPFIEAVRAAEGECVTRWGVVCGVY